MRKITIGFQISGENIDSVGMMEDNFSQIHMTEKDQSPSCKRYVGDKLEICLKFAWDILEVPTSRAYI